MQTNDIPSPPGRAARELPEPAQDLVLVHPDPGDGPRWRERTRARADRWRVRRPADANLVIDLSEPALEPVVTAPPAVALAPVTTAHAPAPAPKPAETVLDDLTAQRLHRSINELRELRPEMSAARAPSAVVRWAVRLSPFVLLVCFVLRPLWTTVALSSVATVAYLSALVYKALLFRKGLRLEALIRVDDEAARSIADEDLPRVTVLVPVYKEPESVRQLIESLEAMEYPHDRLEVLVLLEADDQVTIDAVRALEPRSFVREVVVPAAEPRTKPKACNYGLYEATGDVVVIYDAEDKPEPLQLRRAAHCIASSPPDVVCVQAKLDFYNPRQNRITKWFTLDYGTWFNLMLPGLVGMGAPVPLGGTSNFFRREALESLGAWDPFNVTEDADLGLRLAREGYRTVILDSTTYEEANSDLINWIKQRSRWYKGYLQTAAVHLRQPRRTFRELGWKGFAGVVLFVGGTPVLAALNPFNWALTLLWIISQPLLVKRLFPGPVYYMALICLVIGNLMTIYHGLIAARVTRNEDLARSALSMPAYWLMMSIAAIKAMWQLVRSPFHWEKTQHGLHHTDHAAAPMTDAPWPNCPANEPRKGASP